MWEMKNGLLVGACGGLILFWFNLPTWLFIILVAPIGWIAHIFVLMLWEKIKGKNNDNR